MERYIETERLILKPLTAADAPEVFVWNSDPEVNRYMCYNLYHDVKQTEQWIKSIAKDALEFGFFLKDGGKCIGSGGVGLNPDGVHELGYNLNRAYWNQGYTTEASLAMLRWAHEQLGGCDFVSSHAIGNIGSQRVIEKCGFQLDHYGQYSRFDGSETFDAAFYRLHLEEQGRNSCL